jgi:hypothetical protein
MSERFNSRGVEATIPALNYHAIKQLGGEVLEDNRYHNISDPTTDLGVTPPRVGDFIKFADGSVLRYVRNRSGATIAQGRFAINHALDNITAAASGFDTLVAGDEIGAIATIVAGTGIGETSRYVIQNGTNWIMVDRPFDTLPTATTDITLTYPWHVDTAGALAKNAIGVVVFADIEDDNYGWIQTAGVCLDVLVDDSTAVTAVTPIVCEDAGVRDWVGTTEDYAIVGLALCTTGAVSDFIPCRLGGPALLGD